jgi:hypothetical protein
VGDRERHGDGGQRLHRGLRHGDVRRRRDHQDHQRGHPRDTVVEPDETFTVVLSNPQGATLGTASGTVRILNDDVTAAPKLSVADVRVTEATAGRRR